ncbi:MAG: zf-HC2 domain-containing protein [Eubacterium sp.]
MKCNIVEDLLPEYIDGICQPETAEEIGKHLQECSNCQKKYQRMREGVVETEIQNLAGMEDIKPFQKISKVLKKNRNKKIAAITLLVIVCAVFGTLTIGQIYPELPCPSYDSLMYRYEAKKVAKQFAEGDIEEVLAGMGVKLTSQQYVNQKAFFQDMTTQIKQLHQKIFVGKKSTIRVDDVCYEGVENATEPEKYERYGYDVRVTVTCGEEEMVLELLFYNRYSYSFRGIRGNGDTVAELEAYLDFYYNASRSDNLEKYLTNERISGQNKDNLSEDKAEKMATMFLTKDCKKISVKKDEISRYQENVGKRLYDILGQCKENSFCLTDGRYNSEKKAYDSELYWKVLDKNGKKCILTQKFLYGPMGYQALEEKDIQAEAGFDAEMKQKIERVFES